MTSGGIFGACTKPVLTMQNTSFCDQMNTLMGIFQFNWEVEMNETTISVKKQTNFVLYFILL